MGLYTKHIKAKKPGIFYIIKRHWKERQRVNYKEVGWLKRGWNLIEGIRSSNKTGQGHGHTLQMLLQKLIKKDFYFFPCFERNINEEQASLFIVTRLLQVQLKIGTF